MASRWLAGPLHFFHYQTGVEFSRVCEAVIFLTDGYTDRESKQHFSPTGIDVNAIMLDVKRQEALLKADIQEGRAIGDGNSIRAICDARVRLA